MKTALKRLLSTYSITIFFLINIMLQIFVIRNMYLLVNIDTSGRTVFAAAMLEVIIGFSLDYDFLQFCYIPSALFASALLKKRGMLTGVLTTNCLSLVSFLIVNTYFLNGGRNVLNWMKINMIGGSIIYCVLYVLSSMIIKKMKSIYSRYKINTSMARS